MRIPNINQTGVGGAEQMSLGAISSAASAKFQRSASLTKVVNNYQDKVQKAEQESELHSASIGLEKDTQALMQNISEQAAFDADGNPTYNNMKPQFDKGLEGIIKKYGDNLNYPASKTAYTQSADIYSLQVTGKMNSLHRTRQTEFLQGELTQNLIHYETDLENGLINAKANIESKVAGQVITMSRGEQEMDQFRAKWQFNVTLDAFGTQRADSYESGADFLEAFTDSPPEGMPIDEQLTLQSRMNTFLGQDRATAKVAAALVTAEEKVRQASLEKLGNSMADQLKEGGLVTDKFIVEYENTANQITDTDVQKSMAQALAWSEEIRTAIGTMTISDLNQMRNEALGAGANNLDESEHNEFIAASIEKMMTLVKNDPQQAAVQMGLLKPQINTLQEGIDSGDLKTFISEMDSRKMKLDEVWGINSALFSDADTNILAQMIDQKGSDFLGGFIDNVGQRSYDVLEKLLGKVSNDKVILGTLMAQVDGQEAVKHVTAGMKLKGSDVLPTMADMSPAFNTRFNSGLYPQSDANFRMGMIANVRHAYASLSVDDNDYSKDINEERMNAAMDMVMQKPVSMRANQGHGSINYSTFPARRGMGQTEMIKWKNSHPASTFDTITNVPDQEILDYAPLPNARTPSSYSDLSGPTEMRTQSSSEYIKQLIEKNVLELTSYGEQGRYYLMWNNQTLMAGNEPFILEYKE